MLQSKDKEKLVQYIDKICKDLSADAQRSIKSGMAPKEVVDKTANAAVKKLTPESKMILSSAYNMLMEQTLSDPLYSNSRNKAAFYEANLLKKLQEKFVFDVPKDITCEEGRKELGKWAAAGAVVVTGGVVSIVLESCIPVGIAAVIAGLMVFVVGKYLNVGSSNVTQIIEEYLVNVKQSLLLWIGEVERYYDSQVSELERKLVG